jgi:hypothetical protein
MKSYQHPSTDVDIKKATLTGPVGFSTLPKQIEKKLLKKGFTFNIMLVGKDVYYQLNCI